MFYEQYLTIVKEGLFNISLCLLPTFVVCCLLLGLDLRSGLLNLITIIMIVVDTVGVMTLWSIDYNAVALINLVTVGQRLLAASALPIALMYALLNVNGAMTRKVVISRTEKTCADITENKIICSTFLFEKKEEEEVHTYLILRLISVVYKMFTKCTFDPLFDSINVFFQ